MRLELLIPLLLLPLAACGSSDPTAPEEVVPPPAREQHNLAYGAGADQVVDVYLPDDQTRPAPILVLIHGGAWHWGDKADFDETARNSRRLGFAVFNMNYRLGAWPTYTTLEPKLDDIDAVVAFARSRPGEWRLSSSVALMGASAGGHLALQQAYTRSPQSTCAVVSLFGPTNFLRPDYRGELADAVTLLLGRPLTDDPASVQRYREGSPLHRVRAGLPPTLLIHGTADPIVPYADSADLDAALQAVGVPSRLLTVEGGDHGGNWTNWDAVSLTISDWLARHCP